MALTKSRNRRTAAIYLEKYEIENKEEAPTITKAELTNQPHGISIVPIFTKWCNAIYSSREILT